MIITNSLGSNYSGEDILLSLALLFQPWKWKNGPETERLENAIRKTYGDGRIASFQKGRQAIGEALRILKIGTGDEVIVQAFTCVAVVQPILETGAKSVYADTAPRSLNPPLSSIKAAVTPKTKVVILQHTLGYVNSENEEIVSWCKQKRIAVIQDLAHSLGAPGFIRFNLAAARLNLNTYCILSFSQDKVVDGVSGGALITSVIPGNDPESIKNLYRSRIPSTALRAGKSGMIMKILLYPFLTHLVRLTYQYQFGKLLHFVALELDLLPAAIEVSDTGQFPPLSPSPMPNACAALALQQLKRIDKIAAHRKNLALLYEKVLRSDFRIVSQTDILSGSNLRYPIWVNNRDELEEKLKKHHFYLLDHWYDAPISPPRVDAEALYYRKGSCPNAEELSKHVFNLPTHINISESQAQTLARLINQSQGVSLSDRNKWESALDGFPEANFLQSWAWGEFHQKLGHPVYRIHEKNWMFQAIVEPAKRARYLTVPGGPLSRNWDIPTLKNALSSMKEVAKRECCVFIRIRPQLSDTPQNRSVIQKLGFRPAPMHLHAELTRVLDLTKTDEQLLSEMRKSTRYEIRRVEKMGIRVEQSLNENLIDDFIKLQMDTAKREGFVPFTREYLLEQFRAFKKTDSVLWFFVSNKESPFWIISIAFVIFYRGEAVYHYAASSNEARKIPAAYAIQWAIIQEARKRGCKTYNLWGDVADDKLDSHRFAGPSLFKRGFGGQQVSYLHAHDFPLSRRYRINWIVETIRKYGRGLD